MNERNVYVALAAEQSGTPYDEMRATMSKLRDRFGITYREFAQQRFYRHPSDRAMDRAVTGYIEREGKQITKVARLTGWSLEEAERRMRATKKRWPNIDFRKYVGYGFYNMTEQEITDKIDGWNSAATANRELVQEATGWPLKRVRTHMTRFQVLYDIIPAYYICYRCWELTDEQAEGYARQKLSAQISARLNKSRDTAILGQKDKFDRIYTSYVRRKFWVNEKSATFDDFLEFAEGLEEAFCKPLGSGGGLGTFKVDLRGDLTVLRAVYDNFYSQPLVLVEESVKQHPAINEFYPNSVNTVRLVTVQDHNGVQVISAGIRFGSNGIVDNFSADGMVSDVDLATGRIATAAVDKKGNVYQKHPYSNKKFVGFELPFWDEIVQTAHDAMAVLPGVNYVGWDIAIGPEFVSLIEGNSEPDLVLVQAPYAPAKEGKRYLFQPWLEIHPAHTPVIDAVRDEARDIQPSDYEPKMSQSKRKIDRPILRDGHGLDSIRKIVKRTVRVPSAKSGVSEVHRDGVRYRLRGGSVTVLGRSPDATSTISIPAAIDGEPVTAIVAQAFENDSALVSITLPESLREVGKRAFANCTALTSVTCAAGTERIRAEAFRGCSNLTSVELPETLAELNSLAFAECSALTSIELPEKVVTINKRTFEGATALTTVGLSYSLARVGMESFKDCVALSSLYYYSKRGISDVMVTDRDLKLVSLPPSIEYIGIGAFQNCGSLESIDLPRLVVDIPDRVFLDCVSLKHVGLNNRLKSVGERTFSGCTSLASLRVPFGCRQIGANAFSAGTTVIASKTSYAAKHAAAANQRWRAPSYEGSRLHSTFVPVGTSDSHAPFYTSDEMDGAVERFEIRPPAFRAVNRGETQAIGEVPPSRFVREDGIYHGEAHVSGEARVMVVGDLMSHVRQQVVAARKPSNAYDFSFDHVRSLFAHADFVTGNLESMVSPSAPYTLEMEHVDARPHLNSPPSFMAALRRAGIDCVTNAQNHVYDAGTRGVLETLDWANRCQLIHTGAYVSSVDPRFVVVSIDGIRVGIVAYLDSARQMMKKANFTKSGLATMFPYFERDRIAEDISAARAAGAEYVIANCHWGREYTAEVTMRQRGFAEMVVEAGADYIVGAHPHCVQPYEVLVASDMRRVPCVWSAGNFISALNVNPPITRDTLVVDLRLRRDEAGKVTLVSNGYHPCRIMNLRDGDDRNYAVVPGFVDLGFADLNQTLAEAQDRIASVVGQEFRTVQPSR